jgi:hypothetical protein
MTDGRTQKLIDSEWANLLSRLLWVEARLSTPVRERLFCVLLEFLWFAKSWPDALTNWWSPEEFRTVVIDCFS